MEDNYYIDLKSITLSEYKKELEITELLPSRKILKEDINNRFLILEKNGIKNLNDILLAIKTPDKIKNFAYLTGLPDVYLAILKREIASNQPKPVILSDIPDISSDTILKLKKMGIINTKQIFQFIKTKSDRLNLSNKSSISYDKILELTKITDVSRIKWVGANFARLLVNSPEDTTDKVANADYKKLYESLVAINKQKKYFKGMFGLNDMKLCVIAAGKAPLVIEY